MSKVKVHVTIFILFDKMGTKNKELMVKSRIQWLNRNTRIIVYVFYKKYGFLLLHELINIFKNEKKKMKKEKKIILLCHQTENM